MKSILFWIMFLILIISSPLMGQEEVQVSPDISGKLDYITADIEKRLKLFTEYSNFIEARCFQLSDSMFVIEIMYKDGKTNKRAKKTYTAEEFNAFRSQVSSLLENKAPETILNQEGRSRLLTVSSIIGLTYYGWAVPTMVSVDEEKAFIGLYMLSAGSSFYLPYAITRSDAVSRSQADLFMYGQIRGALHGTILTVALSKNADEQLTALFGLVFSISESIVGYRWAKKENMTRGDALTIGLWGDFGMGIFAGTSHVFGLLENDVGRRLSAISLLGAATGITAGNWMRKHYQYTTGDVYVQRSLGFLGAYIPVAVAGIFEADEGKIYTGLATVGALGGLTFGHYIAQKNDYTAGQGRLIALGQTAGGLIGLGTGYLISSESDNAYKVWLAGSILGSVGGFALMNHLFADRELKENSKTQAFHFGLNPQGFFGLSQKNKIRDPRYDAPMVYASLRF